MVNAKRWSNAEELKLLKRLQGGESLEDIANDNDNGRAIGGLTIRRNQIAMRLYKEGKPKAVIQKETMISDSDYEEQLGFQPMRNGGEETVTNAMLLKEICSLSKLINDNICTKNGTKA